MLIFAGAIGNMIDRAFRGYVIDFIYVECINFPVFNVADCYITIATAVLFILFLFVYKQEDDFDFLKIKHG
jgi:signal peptidase II